MRHAVGVILSDIFKRYTEKSPVSVMARTAMEVALSPDDLDAMFDKYADKQYTRKLLFSTMVDLMGLVVSKTRPSMHAAFQQVKEPLGVSITALYDKLNGLEPTVSSALVQHTTSKLAPLIESMNGKLPALIPGYRTRIIDGNHHPATERRLKVLRRSKAGPLPGHSLVVLDPELMLATNMIPCEDGHAQERSLSEDILKLVESRDVWVADRNFCTARLLFGVAERGAFFIIRHHANMTLEPVGALNEIGRTETGDVHEQDVIVTNEDGKQLAMRKVLIKLTSPTRDGDHEMAILTNLPQDAAGPIHVSQVYRKRWTLETLFQSLTQMLEGEIAALGYPRAALFTFSVTLATYNVLSTVQAALRGHYGSEKIQEEVSGYYIATEVRATSVGMDIAIDDDMWLVFQTMTHRAIAKEMLQWASKVKLRQFKRHPRGAKKPVPKRDRFVKETHVSTARLLAKSRKSRKKAP